MTRLSVTALVEQGRVERIEADVESARSRAAEARRHLDSASAIAKQDPEGAYSLAYDAARKAIDAHMLGNGYRVSKSRLGAHEAVGVYAMEVLAEGTAAADVKHFDRMRRTRNRSEYGSWAVGQATVEADLTHARAIVEAVESDLSAEKSG